MRNPLTPLFLSLLLGACATSGKGSDTSSVGDDGGGDGTTDSGAGDGSDGTTDSGADGGTDGGTDGGADGAGAQDADGDGYLPSVDCDDADPSVHPGAEETWYDGVDQDCDGADDDQDGDGADQALDCDDTDPSAYPGAGEVPGDGVDQDCDGEDLTLPDSGDEDGDGYANEALHGPDCDDSDPAVHPDAPERAGDGVDQDCDGADHAAELLSEGQLIITEIMYDSDAVSDSVGEYLEVLNLTDQIINLRGLLVSDDPAFGEADIFEVDDDVLIGPDERLVLGVNADLSQNGGVPVDYDYAGGGVNLNNAADDLALGARSGGSVVTIDAVSWDELAGWPAAKGVSIELRDTSITSTANDSSSAWCLATSVAGSTTDRGSPGSPSSGC
jgi:Putative metal-binding motif